jgi:hypothetical protein
MSGAIVGRIFLRRPALTSILAAWSVTASGVAACQPAKAPERTPAASGSAVAGPDAANTVDAVATSETPEVAPDWKVTSRNGAYELRQTAIAPESCRLACTFGGKLFWSASICAATKYQLVFLDDGGESFLVLESFPEFQEGALLRTEVGALFHRDTVRKKFRAEEFAKDPEKLRRSVKHYYWLKTDGPQAPREVRDGIELQALDGQVRVVGFDGTVADATPRDGSVASTPEPTISAHSEPALPGADPAEENRWRELFRAAHQRIENLTAQLEQKRQHLKDLDRTAPSLPSRPKDPNVVVDGLASNQQRERALAWQGYQDRVHLAQQADEDQKEIERLEGELRSAQEELQELERKASLQGIPFEWRK